MYDYSYSYEDTNDSHYCYPNSTVLINQFNIHDAAQLAGIERNITGLKILELQSKPLKGKFNLQHLQMIHKAIFEDIYAWAGEIREGDFLMKGDTLFCRGPFIESYAMDIYANLERRNFLRGLEKELLIEQLAYFMGEVNALHPFREGNGRTQRLYFYYLAKNAGYDLNFVGVDKSALLQADIAAFSRNYSPLIEIMRHAVSAL